MANSGLKGPQIGIKFRFHREVLLQQSRCQKVSQNGNCFPFFSHLFVFLFPTSLCGVLVFRLDPAALLRPPPPRRTHHYSSLTHTHSLTPSLARSLPHSLTTHYSLLTTHNPLPTTHYSLLTTHLTSLTHSLTHSLTQAGAVQRACLLRGRRTTQSLLAELRRAWPPLGPRLPFWQAQYTEPMDELRSTQSLLDELRRAWPPLGPRLPLAWQAQYTEPPGRAAARVAAAGAAAAFGVAGAVRRASWTSCGARGRRWGRGCLLRGRRSTQSLLSCAARHHRCLWRGRRSTQSLLDELRRAWPPLGPRLPFAWQAQYTEPPHHL